VILAGRNPQKGADAVARIRQSVPEAEIGFERLDLASLKSVAEFSDRLASERQGIDVLVNNAGVMVPPQRRETGTVSNCNSAPITLGISR
jgi:NAD(P)-dependent dehydrogenase (short-subunit alcohol dehydrogenase family)